MLDGAEVVVKRTTSAERTALRLLDDLPVEPGVVIPRLLRSGVDEIGHWVVAPYYDGQAAVLATVQK